MFKAMALSTRFLVFILGFSLLVSTFDAIPISRIRNLISEEHSPDVSGNIHSGSLEDSWDESIVSRRMDLTTNDYQGSGANDRHTPSP
ncbi:hypothetical protein Ccrd_023240 [Cynara cardunculus var. scolymus]|uniref:Uncharacterized protein n=1 Tax=Cynara cardunculus var. scolymus TaxID=59895 RepID=A0A124SE02_CYNCS|nr:hypothetical protein Ccrd_023240 [Cynara cardunculus var. scolymus]